MLLGGLQKTTLIDFPGRVACTVFTVGCNFRCPFCHNKDLVSFKNFKNAGLQEISEQSFFALLKKRKKILDGVCVTGGEPAIQPDLPGFCQEIKDLGFEVKVDTNGSRPAMLRKLIERGVVDFVAMDIKTVFDEYSKAINVKCPAYGSDYSTRPIRPCSISDPSAGKQNSKLINKIKKSIKLILKSGLEYEFRTTVVPGIHDEKIMVKLAKDLKKITQSLNHSITKSLNYVLQQFQPKNCLDPKYIEVKPFSSQEMRDILKSVQKVLPNTKLRNAD